MGANFSSVRDTSMGMGVPPKRNSSAPPKKNEVIAIHSLSKWEMHFEASRKTSKLVLIDFTASWCKPCHVMQPVINWFAEKYADVEFIKIDVDELDAVTQKFGVHVMPTFILMKKGKEVARVAGAKKQELQNKIEKHRF